MKYSIITINYNNCDGLRRTIESVVNQTFRDFEYIIIDGGSTDGSVEVIKEYADRIDYWVSEPDKGIYNAMNKGILQAHGEYLNFMNSGDCFYGEDVLDSVSHHLDSDLIVGKYHKSNEPIPWSFLYEDVSMLDLYVGTFCHQATFIKRTLFKKHLYDENLNLVADWHFFLIKLIKENVSFRNIDTVIAWYDATGVSSQLSEQVKEERKNILNQFLEKRITVDYERFAAAYYLIDILPLLEGSYRYQKLIRWTLKTVSKLRWVL